MKKASLRDMTRGWFVGAFSPTVYDTQVCEVALKRYRAGECERAHYHKVATEITVVVSGRVRMNGEIYEEDDVIVVEPYDKVAFEALTDAVCAVVKLPGALSDKYEDG